MGLAAFAGAEDEVLLDAAPIAEDANAQLWSAAALPAHLTGFGQQQLQRPEAAAERRVPPELGEIDHGSEVPWRAYGSRPAGEMLAESRHATRRLVEQVAEPRRRTCPVPPQTLARGPAALARVVVRGFWHPTGHIASHLGRGHRADRFVMTRCRATGYGQPSREASTDDR